MKLSIVKHKSKVMAPSEHQTHYNEWISLWNELVNHWAMIKHSMRLEILFLIQIYRINSFVRRLVKLSWIWNHNLLVYLCH